MLTAWGDVEVSQFFIFGKLIFISGKKLGLCLKSSGLGATASISWLRESNQAANRAREAGLKCSDIGGFLVSGAANYLLIYFIFAKERVLRLDNSKRDPDSPAAASSGDCCAVRDLWRINGEKPHLAGVSGVYLFILLQSQFQPCSAFNLADFSRFI